MKQDVMSRVPEKKIVQTIESMQRDLNIAYEQLQEAITTSQDGLAHSYDDRLHGLLKVRTFADELIRWMIL